MSSMHLGFFAETKQLQQLIAEQKRFADDCKELETKLVNIYEKFKVESEATLKWLSDARELLKELPPCKDTEDFAQIVKDEEKAIAIAFEGIIKTFEYQEGVLAQGKEFVKKLEGDIADLAAQVRPKLNGG